MQETAANGPVSKTSFIHIIHIRSLSLLILNPRAAGRVELSSDNNLCGKGSLVR